MIWRNVGDEYKSEDRIQYIVYGYLRNSEDSKTNFHILKFDSRADSQSKLIAKPLSNKFMNLPGSITHINKYRSISRQSDSHTSER